MQPSTSPYTSALSWPSRGAGASGTCDADILTGQAGIVTSPRGAAIADMVNILSRRFPGLHIRLFPALVQGTLPQARVTKLSPRPVNEADLARLFEDSMQGW